MVKVAGVALCIILLSFLALHNTSSAETQDERPKSPIKVFTDKTYYHTGEVVKIEGSVPELNNGRDINIIAKDADGETFAKSRIKPTSDGGFEASFRLPLYSKLLPIGKWTIEVSYAIWATKVDIQVFPPERREIYPLTISKPELVVPSSAKNVTIGEDVMIVTEASNDANKDQHIFYIVQVKDELGTTVFLNWLTRILNANETVNLTVTWRPELEGKYTLETFVWDDIENPAPLSPSQNVSVTVVM